MEIINRKEAKEQGLKYYFTGDKCVNNHVAERNTKTKACVVCREDTLQRYYSANKELVKERAKIWVSENQEQAIETRKSHYKNNKEKVDLKNKNWAKNNKDKRKANYAQWKSVPENYEKTLVASRKSKKKHRAKRTSEAAYRRAHKRNATPKWADLKSIEAIYKSCPKGFHVDHIIPLINKLVCGLHVESNLQILEKIENLKKSNRFEPVFT